MQAHSTPRERRLPRVLVLTGPARLAVRRGRLYVEDGFGNLGTRRTLEYEPPLSLQSVILLTQGGLWSDHALRMLTENGASLYSLRQSGEVEYFLVPPAGPIKPGLLRLQASLPDTELGVELAKEIIRNKVEGQQATLAWLAEKATLARAEECGQSIATVAASLPGARSLEEVRWAESRAAEAYFRAWKGLPVSFRKPAKGCVDVPGHWSRWENRLSLKTGEKQDATDPLNALLNFAYTVTATETLICCRAASLDPGLGLIHLDMDGRPSFVYDLMEPLRPVTDRLVLDLVTRRTFRVNHEFMLMKEGLCRLGVEFAAEVGQLVSEKVRPEAEKLCESVRKSLLSVATTTYRVPRVQPWAAGQTQPQGRPVAEPIQGVGAKTPGASPLGVCCRCGAQVGPRQRYCNSCRSARWSETWQKEWEKRRAEGHDPAHGGEAGRKRSETMSRSRALRPRPH